jgi:YbbR domain-containing protein
MAVFTWYLVTGRDLVETWVDFPLEITNPPDGMIIRGGMVSHISARLRGPKGLIRNLETKKLAYSLDTGKLKVGDNAINVSAAHLSLAGAIEVMEIRPSSLNLSVDMFVDKKVDVSVKHKGSLPSDYKLLDTSAEPSQVTLRGPASILKKIDKVQTRTLSLAEHSPEDFSGEIPLDLPKEVESSPAVVKVILDFVVKKEKMWVKVPINFLAPEGVDIDASQNYVRLLVEAPKPFFRKSNFRDEIEASVDLNDAAAGDIIKNEKKNYPISISLPDGCTVAEMKPQQLAITVLRGQE